MPLGKKIMLLGILAMGMGELSYQNKANWAIMPSKARKAFIMLTYYIFRSRQSPDVTYRRHHGNVDKG